MKRTRFPAAEAGAVAAVGRRSSSTTTSSANVTHFRLLSFAESPRLGPEVTLRPRLPVADGGGPSDRAEQRGDGRVAERIGSPQRRHRPAHGDSDSTTVAPSGE